MSANLLLGTLAMGGIGYAFYANKETTKYTGPTSDLTYQRYLSGLSPEERARHEREDKVELKEARGKQVAQKKARCYPEGLEYKDPITPVANPRDVKTGHSPYGRFKNSRTSNTRTDRHPTQLTK